MRKGNPDVKIIRNAAAAAVLAALAACGPGAPQKATPKTDDDKTVYAVGVAVQKSLETFQFSPAELELVIAGLRDSAAGKPYRVVRLLSTDLDPGRLVGMPGASPMDAFREFVRSIATQANASASKPRPLTNNRISHLQQAGGRSSLDEFVRRLCPAPSTVKAELWRNAGASVTEGTELSGAAEPAAPAR